MRFEVKFDFLAPPGTKRWIIWDNEKQGFADEPRYDRESAQGVCDDLNEFEIKDDE